MNDRRNSSADRYTVVVRLLSPARGLRPIDVATAFRSIDKCDVEEGGVMLIRVFVNAAGDQVDDSVKSIIQRVWLLNGQYSELRVACEPAEVPQPTQKRYGREDYRALGFV
jgi:hypothetical protein